MMNCECPICNNKIDLDGYEEYDVLECPTCGVGLEVVSLMPPVLEEVSEEDGDWDNDGDWDDEDD